MRFLLSKLRIFLFFPIPYLSQPLSPATKEGSLDHLIIIKVERGKTSCPEGIFCWSYPLDNCIIRKNYGKSMSLKCELQQIFEI